MADVVFTVMKGLASVFLLAFFIAGAFKANPRAHNPEISSAAEYFSGFLICAISIFGLYYLWFD